MARLGSAAIPVTGVPPEHAYRLYRSQPFATMLRITAYRHLNIETLHCLGQGHAALLGLQSMRPDTIDGLTLLTIFLCVLLSTQAQVC